MAWVAGNPAVTAPIIGARTLKQLDDSLAAVNIDMTPDLWREISDLAVSPPYPTDRPDDQMP